MTKRDKIIETLKQTSDIWKEEERHSYIVSVDLEKIADALIAAGIGDVKRHRVFVSKDGKEVKQFYSGEEVENIVKERNELKVELRDKVDYIHEQDEVIKEYKHRAEVAEKALLDCIKDSRPAHCSIAVCSKWTRCGDDTCVETRRAIFIEQAEREIEEEKGE